MQRGSTNFLQYSAIVELVQWVMPHGHAQKRWKSRLRLVVLATR